MQEMVERYLAAWNEKDAERRRGLVDALWTEDGSYTDPLADARGRAVGVPGEAQDAAHRLDDHVERRPLAERAGADATGARSR